MKEYQNQIKASRDKIWPSLVLSLNTSLAKKTALIIDVDLIKSKHALLNKQKELAGEVH